MSGIVRSVHPSSPHGAWLQLFFNVRHRTDACNLPNYIGHMINTTVAPDELRATYAPAKPITVPHGFATSRGRFGHACPACQGGLVRIWRRPLDRFTSQFVPVHRFGCERFSCGWEGNLRIDAAQHAKRSSVLERASAMFMVTLLLATVVLAVSLLVATVGWISDYGREPEQLGLGSQQGRGAISLSTDFRSIQKQGDGAIEVA